MPPTRESKAHEPAKLDYASTRQTARGQDVDWWNSKTFKEVMIGVLFGLSALIVLVKWMLPVGFP